MDTNFQTTSQTTTISIKAEQQLLYQKEIDSLGYTGQNSFLVQNGFKKLKKNLKTLKTFKGDQILALNHLTAKRDKKADKKNLKQTEDQSDYNEQNIQLVGMGYVKIKKNLKLLRKYKGDISSVVNVFVQKKEEKAQKKAQKIATKQQKFTEKQLQYQNEIDSLGFTNQNAFLVQNGFIKLKRNVKALKKFNGEQTLALNQLTARIAIKIEERSQRSPSTAFTEQLNKLTALGYLNSKKNLKLLNKFKGDFDAVLNLLVQKQQIKNEKQLHKLNIND